MPVLDCANILLYLFVKAHPIPVYAALVLSTTLVGATMLANARHSAPPWTFIPTLGLPLLGTSIYFLGARTVLLYVDLFVLLFRICLGPLMSSVSLLSTPVPALSYGSPYF